MKSSDVGATVAQFFGWLLMAVGGLIMLTAGGCSVFVLLSSLGYPEGLPGMLMMILMFGGVPILVGLGLFLAGRHLAKAGAPRQSPPSRIRFEDDGSGL
jgi:hypothetical protein